MKVERPRARSSAAPTRLNSRSTMPIVACLAGTKEPACAITAISAFWRRKVDLPAMLGPVSSHSRRAGPSSQSLGTKPEPPCRSNAASTTGCRPPTRVNSVPSDSAGRT